MGRSLQLLVKGGKRNPQNKHCQTMKLFSILFCVGLSQAFLVRREADAEAKPEADAEAGHYGYAQGAVSAPVCNSVPVKTCNPRNVETPRKECHQEYDEIVDTTITAHCEEVVTTTCQQTSTQVHKSAAIVGHDSKVVATGVASHPVAVAHAAPVAVAGVAHAGYGKREADAEAAPEADAGHYGYSAPVVKAAPICESVPVKKCNKVPVSTPRKVGRTVCKTVVDITTIEDCTETITTECKQVSTKVAHSSAVVGHDTKVGPAEVVAHAAAAPAVAVAAPVVAGYGGYGLAGYGGW